MTFFKRGVPVWPVGQRGKWNQVVGFYGSLQITETTVAADLLLRITAADCYRVWLNGRFFAYGPARTAHGYSRVDEWLLDEYVEDGVNHVAIEVNYTGIDSYAYASHSPFLQAEVMQDGESLLATGNASFTSYRLQERIQKVERFSKQRPFAEAYRLSVGCNDWRFGKGVREPVGCEQVDPCKLLPRHVPLPDFRCVDPLDIYAYGTVVSTPRPESALHHAARDKVGLVVGGYPVEELEIDMSRELLAIGFVPVESAAVDRNGCVPARGYACYDFGSVQGGFIEVRLRCDAITRVYLQFDETLDRDPDNPFTLGVGAVALDLEPGEHDFTSFEPYSMRYLRVIACDAPVAVCGLCIREYVHPVPEPSCRFSDPELKAIFHAGWQTFRTNSVDLFTDCMSRERGGYPCDSYFTAQAERALAGESRVERNFLENYFLVDSFSSIPRGMVPHCYPSDRLGKGQYIPNWGLWLVLELCEYCLRTGDQALQDLACSRVEALFDWFTPHRNALGLLEDVPGWIFVEWSAANDYTDAVNYPTNMLYSRCLSVAADLYERQRWKDDAAETREAIRRESWDGHWFADQSKRVDGVLQRTDMRSETCQYHALFFGMASPDESKSLWSRLRDAWGPMGDKRTAERAFRSAADGDSLVPAELLYGLMLRFDLLKKAGEQERLIAELRHVFGPMAKQSGTLWEHATPRSSLNHGFAACACALLRSENRMGI